METLVRMEFLTYSKLDVPPSLERSFQKVRAAIERDDFASPEVKKLSGRPFFRAKLDYENRLLLQVVEHAGRRACLALELIEHHAYDRSRFLRGARIDETRELEAQAPTADIAAAARPVRYLHPGRRDFHVLDKPISFDDRQAEIFALPTPMILVGCAGSGKTALTLTKLRELPGQVLYVTESRFLAESAASLYFAHGYENDAQEVDFLSYQALLESFEVPRGRRVTPRDFAGLFKRHEGTLGFTSAHQLFEELRGVLTADPDGPLSLEQYLELGVRQSIYAPEQRRAIHAFLGKYRTWLSDSGLYDTNLLAQAYREKAEARYDAVVVDEVQDLTNAELALVLATLKNAEGFLLCGDANQIVHPNFFSWSKVKSLFYRQEQAALAAPIHVLGVNYRSSRAVCGVANTLLKLKNARFGSIDRESTALVSSASGNEGRVIGLVKKDSVLRELNQRTKGSVEVAVIVLSDDKKAEARQRFATPLVFSIHEAKGLEYDAVVLYDMVSTERARFAEIAAGVSASDLVAEELVYARARDKGDKSLEVYKFFVNALYVGLTRAVTTVYLVEADSTHPLLAKIGVACGEDLSGLETRTSTLEDWQREARRLEAQGKQEQAEAIRKSILRTTPVPWPVLDREGYRQTRAKVFEAGSVHSKAKQHLFEFAAFHDLGSLARTVERVAGHHPPRPLEETAEHARERAMGPYLRGDTRRVLEDVGRYGIDHRSMMGMTPLMMATDVGDVPLVEDLLSRGAQVDAIDPFGRMPIHFALRRAFADDSFARDRLGALYELLCPSAIELELDGHRLRLSRAQGEFFALLCVQARFHECYRRTFRYSGFGAKLLSDRALQAFPRSVVPEKRRKRTYWNGVFARAEVSSAYRPARRLWRRERVGHYVPSRVTIRVAGEHGADDAWVPLDELMGVAHLDELVGTLATLVVA